ncbi:hypothetical protein [Chamaesiphon sp.]
MSAKDSVVLAIDRPICGHNNDNSVDWLNYLVGGDRFPSLSL